MALGGACGSASVGAGRSISHSLLPNTAASLPRPSPQVGADGKEILLQPPSGDELPSRGFDPGMETYQVGAAAMCAALCTFSAHWGVLRTAAMRLQLAGCLLPACFSG